MEVSSRSAGRQLVAKLGAAPETPDSTSTGRKERVRWRGRGLVGFPL